MTKRNKTYLITIIVNIIYLLVLTFIRDPFKENYSMLSGSFLGYIAVFGLCILLSYNFYVPTKKLNEKYIWLSIGPLIGCIFPFVENSGTFTSNAHEVCAYISFVFVMILTLFNINAYKTYNYKKGDFLLKAFIVVFILDGLIYLNTFGVTGIQELILLSASLIVHFYINSNI